MPDEILDQFVRQGPISPEELDAAVRRFKKAIIEPALGGELTHHLGYPPGGEKPDDTTNALASVHAQLRKIIKTRGQFPSDSATKLIGLALRDITTKWERSSPYWRPAMNQFAILCEGRFAPSTT